MVRSKKLVALAATGALVLAACGGSDDTTSDTTAAGGTAAAPGATDAMTDSTDAMTDSTDAMTDSTDAMTDSTDAMTDSTDAMTDSSAAPGDTAGGGDASGAVFTVDTSACDDPDTATAPFEDTIKIGTSVPLSGGPAVLFAPVADGMNAYINYYNETFGGIDGHELELVVKDDQYTADLTVANVDELIFDDQVDLLSGIIGSANNLAIEADMNSQCIPQLNAQTGAPNWGDVENNPWTTGLLVPYAIESQIWAKYAAEQGAKTAGLFYVNNEFGQAYAEAFKAAAEENGIDLIAEETIELGDSGAPSGQVTNLVNANPDTILAVPLGAQCIAFMTELGNQQAANPDFDASIYQTATCANKVFYGAVTNGGSDGVYTSLNLKDVNDPEVAATDDVKTYLDAFAATGSEADPGGIAGAGWQAMELTVNALETASEAGNLSREGVINAARNVNYSPPLLLDALTYTMNADDGYMSEGAEIRQWSDADAGFNAVGDPIDLNGTLGIFQG